MVQNNEPKSFPFRMFKQKEETNNLVIILQVQVTQRRHHYYTIQYCARIYSL
ncbi:hypothetical protein UACE39S_06346 [Ureibacillus acetophenoni]